MMTIERSKHSVKSLMDGVNSITPFLDAIFDAKIEYIQKFGGSPSHTVINSEYERKVADELAGIMKKPQMYTTMISVKGITISFSNMTLLFASLGPWHNRIHTSWWDQGLGVFFVCDLETVDRNPHMRVGI